MVKKVSEIAEYLYKECNWRKQLYWPRLQQVNTARMNESLNYNEHTGHEAFASVSAHNDSQHAMRLSLDLAGRELYGRSAEQQLLQWTGAILQQRLLLNFNVHAHN